MPCSSSLFFNATATTELYTLSLHDALPISSSWPAATVSPSDKPKRSAPSRAPSPSSRPPATDAAAGRQPPPRRWPDGDRKSTRLNSSHVRISYAVFCLKKKRNTRGREQERQ